MKKVSVPTVPEKRNGIAQSVPGVVRQGARKAGDATREKMLDAAEELFANNGFHGTSMRDVAEASDARIALVTYHFGTKDLLFDKVVERRASVMAHRRIQALDAARLRTPEGPLPIKDLVEGYVWPFVERSADGGQGWKSYSRLVARLANSPDWAKIISKHYDAVARQYVVEFRKALPDVSEEDVHHGFSFMVGAMVALIAEPGRVEALSTGRFAASDLRHVYDRLVPFLVAGFHSLVDVGK
ncbi:TetR/AcrR family transcriptional regulator [Paraburkholderia phytofirmans]|nr:TetR/AcrR family transcriptional regulator [Paraburkholderia phytofirmans]